MAINAYIARFVANLAGTWVIRTDTLTIDTCVIESIAELPIVARAGFRRVLTDADGALVTRARIAIDAVCAGQALHAAVVGLVTLLAGATRTGTYADSLRTRIRHCAKLPVIAGIGVGHVGTDRIVAGVVGARVIIVAIRIRNALHAGIDGFIAQLSRTGISRADARSAAARIAGGTKQSIAAWIRVIRCYADVVHACMVRAWIAVLAVGDCQTPDALVIGLVTDCARTSRTIAHTGAVGAEIVRRAEQAVITCIRIVVVLAIAKHAGVVCA